MSSKLTSLFVFVFIFVSSCFADKYDYPQLLTKTELLANRNLLGGVYYAYPNLTSLTTGGGGATPAPKGYTPFYISHYGRHGSRYQPNDSRYANTRQRLRDAHAKGVLTPMGESLLQRIEILCDSCLGHGGMLTALGARQHEAIARRMYRNFPEVFRNGGSISARASIVPRCGQSMQAFIKGLKEEAALSSQLSALRFDTEVNKAYMSYIAYDTPQMRQLADKKAPWQPAYNTFMRNHVNCTPFIRRIYTDATGVDTLQTATDLYWLTVGMQNLDMPFSLDDVFTAEELLGCWQCVNYRMYICNGNSPVSDNIPAESASTLLKNIIETADTIFKVQGSRFRAQGPKCQIATLRFGHDSNLLRLLALMRIHNCANRADKVTDGWQVWQECMLSPMGANIQLVFYHNKKNDILVKILLNEHEILLDVPTLKSVNGCYYKWQDLRQFFLKQIKDGTTQTEFKEPVQ